MCLGANEPGGPRRCESYMRNVHTKLVELQQNMELQAARTEQINKARERISQIDEMDKSHLTESDRKAYDSLRGTLNTQIEKYQADLDAHKKEEESLRRSTTTALVNHKTEVERRQRMGAIVNEQGHSPIDEDSPYLTISPNRFKQMENMLSQYAQAGQPIDYKVRTRMVPVQLGNGTYHPFLTVEETDVQFVDPADQDKFATLANNDDMGHNDTSKWKAPTDKVLQAAYVVSDGGRNYVSQRDADDPEYSTGGLVKSAVFSDSNGSLVDDPSNDIADLRQFAKNYPGDAAYSQKVRAIAAKDYVSPEDVSVLSSAIAGWRQYKDRKNKPPRMTTPAPQSVRPAPATAPTKRAATAPSTPPRQRVESPVGNQYLGEVGYQIPDTPVKVKAVRSYPSIYGGNTTMIIAQDMNNNTIKWNASEQLNIREGDAISIRGVVKEHTEYNGVKQTVITHGDYSILGLKS